MTNCVRFFGDALGISFPRTIEPIIGDEALRYTVIRAAGRLDQNFRKSRPEFPEPTYLMRSSQCPSRSAPLRVRNWTRARI
jgi:hypothetical protein